MPYSVFVSYSTKDIPNVDQLRQLLQFPDVQCFVSEYAVNPGAPLAPTIEASILACDLFILLWSKNAAASEWVPQEIGIAHGAQKTILPFVLEPGLSLPGFIKDLRYVAAFQNQQQSLYQLREPVAWCATACSVQRPGRETCGRKVRSPNAHRTTYRKRRKLELVRRVSLRPAPHRFKQVRLPINPGCESGSEGRLLTKGLRSRGSPPPQIANGIIDRDFSRAKDENKHGGEEEGIRVGCIELAGIRKDGK